MFKKSPNKNQKININNLSEGDVGEDRDECDHYLRRRITVLTAILIISVGFLLREIINLCL